MLSSLTDQCRPLILDASVLINLIATNAFEEVLTSLEMLVVVEDVALGEVTRDPRNGLSPGQVVVSARDKKLLLVETMGAESAGLYLSLTGAPPPNDLGDGEAATLALANAKSGCAVIDERKAARIARERFPDVPVLTTLDILSSERFLDCVGHERAADAVYRALTAARMRIPYDSREWVLELLGPERILDCPSFKRAWIE